MKDPNEIPWKIITSFLNAHQMSQLEKIDDIRNNLMNGIYVYTGQHAQHQYNIGYDAGQDAAKEYIIQKIKKMRIPVEQHEDERYRD